MIDLCVVNYKTPKHLERLLRVLVSDAVESPPWKLYIADNGEDSESRKVLESIGGIAQSIDMNKNIGYSAACNQLASRGNSEYLALLNADIWMNTASVKALEESISADDTIGVLGPKQLDEHRRIVHAGIIGTNEAPKHRGWKIPDLQDIMFKDKIECVTVSGSVYVVRRSAWEKLANDKEYLELFPEAKGAFLPTPHYYEETFCSYFARHRGYKVVYDGSITVGHSWHAARQNRRRSR